MVEEGPEIGRTRGIDRTKDWVDSKQLMYRKKGHVCIRWCVCVGVVHNNDKEKKEEGKHGCVSLKGRVE